MKVELDSSNYAIKGDLKNETDIAKSKFARKVDLPSSESEVDKSGIDKLEKVPTGLSSLIVKQIN